MNKKNRTNEILKRAKTLWKYCCSKKEWLLQNFLQKGFTEISLPMTYITQVLAFLVMNNAILQNRQCSNPSQTHWRLCYKICISYLFPALPLIPRIFFPKYPAKDTSTTVTVPISPPPQGIQLMGWLLECGHIWKYILQNKWSLRAHFSNYKCNAFFIPKLSYPEAELIGLDSSVNWAQNWQPMNPKSIAWMSIMISLTRYIQANTEFSKIYRLFKPVYSHYSIPIQVILNYISNYTHPQTI